MATISQIKIGNQTYDICDANNRQTTETINDTIDIIMANIDDIQDRFSNGVLKTANGGTALNAANGNALLRALGVAKTAGDEIDITYMNSCGHITSGKILFAFSLATRFLFYDYSSASFKSGFYAVRQNNEYLFGSTADNRTKVTAHPNWFSISVRSTGRFDIALNTGSTQNAAINNAPCSITFPRPKDENDNFLEPTVIKLN